MTELIKKKNRYLHEVYAISFIHIVSKEGSFRQNDENGRGGSKCKSVVAIEENAEVSNNKSTGDEQDHSNSTGENNANNIAEEDTTMEDGEHDAEEETNISESEGDTTYSQGNGGNNTARGGDEGDDDISNPDGGDDMILDSTPEENFLQMLLNSAEEGYSLFTSLEPGIHGEYYFMTTKALATRAAEWLDTMMNHFLNKYGISTCVCVFGSNVDKMPREETKVRPDLFILDYISTLQIG